MLSKHAVLCLALFLSALPGALHAAIPLSISPGFASVHTLAQQQFKAIGSGAGPEAATWQVNGISGGSSTVGTISTSGIYTAPSAVPTSTTVTVTALIPGSLPVSVVVAISKGLSFYVSTTGKDTNPGSLALPWRTIQHAADTVLAGDTVYVRGGIYHESINIPRSGSPTAGSIVFQSYPGERAIIDGTGVACCGGTIQGLWNLLANNSYIILQGFEIQNYSSRNTANEPAGIYISGSGSYLFVLNNIVHGITETAGPQGNAHGIGFYGTSATPLSHITLSGNNAYGMVTGNSETITFDGNIVGFTISNNLVHDNNNIGIDATGFYPVGPTGHDQARNGLISGNTVYNISSLKNPAYNGYGADGIYCDGCTEVVIEKNLVYNCDLNIEAASENRGQVASYVTIRNNLVYGANVAGISIGGYANSVGGSDHITIVNNTIYNNNRASQGGDFQIQYHATNNRFENNIVYAGPQGLLVNGVANSTPAPVIADYNIYYTTAAPQWWYQGIEHDTFSAWQSASRQDTHSHFENPDLISVKSPYNFDLSAGSPALATGNFALGAAVYGTQDFVDNPRTTGKTINIGAFQK